MKGKFQIGDRVIIMRDDHGNSHLHVGSLGTVVGFYTEQISHVSWDDWCGGHTCGDKAPKGHGWNVKNSILDYYGDPETETYDACVDFDELL